MKQILPASISPYKSLLEKIEYLTNHNATTLNGYDSIWTFAKDTGSTRKVPKAFPSLSTSSKKKSKTKSTLKAHGLNSGGENWTAKTEALSSEIKVRHYSPKTLKSYATWVRKFQSFLKSKDPAELPTEDVKAFLTSIAVDQKVSASSQAIRGRA